MWIQRWQTACLLLLWGLKAHTHSPLAGNAVSSALALEFAGEGWEWAHNSVSPPSLSTAELQQLWEQLLLQVLLLQSTQGCDGSHG